jgi:hypothetical protein
MKRLLCSCLLIFVFLMRANGQSALQLKVYSFPKTFPEKYAFDPKHAYEEMLQQKRPKGFKRSVYERYAEAMSYQKADAFTEGDMYLNWPEMENYLNAIVRRLAKSNAAYANMTAYVKRSPDMNAFCIHDGSFFINIGLLAEVKNEAALANVLGHEMSHYLMHHLERSYLEMAKVNTKRKRNSNRDEVLANLHQNRGREMQADSLGATLAANAGYSVKEGLGNFYMLLQMEEKELSRAQNTDRKLHADDEEGFVNDKDEKGDKVISSHPDLKRRIRNYKKLAKRYKTSEELGDEGAFLSLQKMARLEVLNLLKEQQDYRACVERAMTYYLFDPSNDAYVYYILEGIRRELFLHPKEADRPFITDNYDEDYYPLKKKGVLANLRVLVPDTANWKNIVATELLNSDTLKRYPFVTWKGAFIYFSKQAKKRGIGECYLTMALYESDLEKRKSLLDKYLAQEKVLYREYAKTLQQNRLTESIRGNTKELLLANEVAFVEDHSYGYHYRRLVSQSNSKGIILNLNKLVKKEFPNKELLVYNDLEKENFSKAMRYKQVMIAAYAWNQAKEQVEEESDEELDAVKVKSDNTNEPATIKRKVQTQEDFYSPFANKRSKKNVTIESDQADLFMLNPDIWKVFNSEKLYALELLNVVSFTDKTQVFGSHMGWAYLCLPYIPYILLQDLYFRVSFGSNKYSYQVKYYSFTPTDKKYTNWYVAETVHYKMYKPYLLSTTYDVLHGRKSNVDSNEKD